MTTAFFVCDEDGNNYGPYLSEDDASDFCDAMFEDRLTCDIVQVDLPFDLQQQGIKYY
jgi:hypothetical protein